MLLHIYVLTFSQQQTVHCVRLLFIVITANECFTSSPVHAHSHTVSVIVLPNVLLAMTVKHYYYYYWGKIYLVL